MTDEREALVSAWISGSATPADEERISRDADWTDALTDQAEMDRLLRSAHFPPSEGTMGAQVLRRIRSGGTGPAFRNRTMSMLREHAGSRVPARKRLWIGALAAACVGVAIVGLSLVQNVKPAAAPTVAAPPALVITVEVEDPSAWAKDGARAPEWIKAVCARLIKPRGDKGAGVGAPRGAPPGLDGGAEGGAPQLGGPVNPGVTQGRFEFVRRPDGKMSVLWHKEDGKVELVYEGDPSIVDDVLNAVPGTTWGLRIHRGGREY